MVLFVVGKKSYESPYIAWEIKESMKRKKPIYILKLNEKNQLHDALFVLEPFTTENGIMESLYQKKSLSK